MYKLQWRHLEATEDTGANEDTDRFNKSSESEIKKEPTKAAVIEKVQDTSTGELANILQ